MSANKSILVCRCAERGLVDTDGIAGGESVLVIPDLCRAVADGDPMLGGAFSEVHACHPRAVQSLFRFAGHPLPDTTQVIDCRCDGAGHAALGTMEDKPPAWYPVIDYDRCSSCGQCLEFCLFGVYEKAPDGRIRVVNPDQCKNNCPACARICPEAAIIFPKSVEVPINGAEIDDEAAVRANIRVNVDEILGDDVYAALRARKQKRKALLNRKKIERALEERRKCSGGDQ
ncbi:MAG: hypothetical protein JXR25_14770 [Pontiellaceae bacterium]|nr:hypothetical protein [Pontiellaceae bacterium]MBN2786083.1 hypothetical protein [Pontiellaceae bacterium]